MDEAILLHGLRLQRLFPASTHLGPVTLCKKLRRLETQAERMAVQICNIGMDEAEQERTEARILKAVDKLLNFTGQNIPVFVNLDPRGYALKIDDAWMRTAAADLHKDWGGYGIIAPDLRENA
jgi:hypothetical protein